MTRLFPIAVLLQATTIEPSLTQVLIQLPMVAIVVVLWVRDGNQRAAERKATEERHAAEQASADARYAALVERVVKVVESNATAMTQLADAVHERTPAIGMNGNGRK